VITTLSFRFDVPRHLDAAEAAMRFQGVSSGNKVSEESRAIYNAAVQEVTVMLRSYWSSHLTGAQSELVVPGPHGSYALPQTVRELKRILRLNLAAASAPRRVTSRTKPERVNRLSDVSAN
jgi:hypothetical protein